MPINVSTSDTQVVVVQVPPGAESTIVEVPGQQGPPGLAGPTGAPGPTGPAGPANTLTIGTVTTGAAGSSAAASITGTAPTQTLNLTIPTGANGTNGTNGTSPVITGTSTTSFAVGTGSKVFVTQAGLALVVGQYVRIASSATPTTYMAGTITAYSGTSLTVNVTETSGTGTIASWNISLTGAPGATPNLTIGTVTTLAAGASATASITGTTPNLTLNLGIPQGAAGTGGAATDATTTAKGIVQLAGDLAGTAAAPTVPALANKAATTTTITAGTGLTGGGDLSASRTLAVSYGSAAGTAVQGNDVRVTADGIATQASIRTLGTGAQQAAAGNDTRIVNAVQTSDARVTADQAAATASIRTIGTGALQAAAGNHTHTTYADKLVTTTTQTVAAYTLVLADAFTIVEGNSATAQTFTVPPNASVAFSVGTTLVVRQYGAGQITIAPGTGVTLRSRGAALKTAGQYAEATLTKRATDEWVISGDIA